MHHWWRHNPINNGQAITHCLTINEPRYLVIDLEVYVWHHAATSSDQYCPHFIITWVRIWSNVWPTSVKVHDQQHSCTADAGKLFGTIKLIGCVYCHTRLNLAWTSFVHNFKQNDVPFCRNVYIAIISFVLSLSVSIKFKLGVITFLTMVFSGTRATFTKIV